MKTNKIPPPRYFSVSLRNFRCFKKADSIKLAPLTFLVGQNSSGKSSIFDALLLLAQSNFSPTENIIGPPGWTGHLVDLGSFKDSVYAHNTRLKIDIGIEFPLYSVVPSWRIKNAKNKPDSSPIRVIFRISSRKDDPNGCLSLFEVVDVRSSQNIIFYFSDKKLTIELLGRKKVWQRKRLGPRREFERWLQRELIDATRSTTVKFRGFKAAWNRLETFALSGIFWIFLESQRVSSGRSAPKRWYPVADLKFSPSRLSLGPSLFDAVDPAMLSESGKDEHLFPFPRQRQKTKESLTDVLEELDIAKAIHDSRLSAYHAGIEITDSVTGVVSHLIDVGYGASQVIPVIHGCLSAANGPLFLEQPEIHLHPRAQATIAELICHTSKFRQVIVETHSVHLINRARILVASGKISSQDVIINFVERTPKGSKVKPLKILPNGDFSDEWPGGFFDERYQDTMFLLELKSEQRD